MCGDFSRPPPQMAEEISGHRPTAVVRRGPTNFSGKAPFRTDWTIFAGKIIGRRGSWAVNPLGRHVGGSSHPLPPPAGGRPASSGVLFHRGSVRTDRTKFAGKN